MPSGCVQNQERESYKRQEDRNRGDSEDSVDCDRRGATDIAAASDRVCGVWTGDRVTETERRWKELPSAGVSEVLGSSSVRAEPEEVNV